MTTITPATTPTPATTNPTTTATTSTTTISPLLQRMIEDMTARNLGRQTQRNHIRAGKLFAAYLKRSLDTATPDDVRLFQMSLIERGLSIQNRNRIKTGLRFLLKVTMRRHDLAAEIYHMKEPQKIPQILSAEEITRLLAPSVNLQEVVHSVRSGNVDVAKPQRFAGDEPNGHPQQCPPDAPRSRGHGPRRRG